MASKPSTNVQDALLSMDRLPTVISCLDVTSLNDHDTPDSIMMLCDNVMSTQPRVAAICVYPQFVRWVRERVRDTGIHIATVVNFPSGKDAMDDIREATLKAIRDGADEIDVVWNITAYLAGDVSTALAPIQAVVDVVEPFRATRYIGVKVIMETGAWYSAGNNTLDAGVTSSVVVAAQAILSRFGRKNNDTSLKYIDFLKTSTGKIPIGATVPAVKGMLDAIQASGCVCGVKVSGGVRTPEQAFEYLDVVQSGLGVEEITSSQFRIGASGLFTALIDMLPSGPLTG